MTQKKKPAPKVTEKPANEPSAKAHEDIFEGQNGYAKGCQFAVIPINEIKVLKQIREEFDTKENTLQELADDIKKRGVVQPVGIRPAETGYYLVFGERRLRASILAGLSEIPSLIRQLTDEQASDIQFSENIHRENLTLIEEAKKLQQDLELLGSVEAVLAKHSKSNAWLSKRLSLLSLPEQTKRLVTESISADLEVISTVKAIEKRDPAKAKALVNDLKKSRGTGTAREKVDAVKQQVKPSSAKGKGAEQPGGGIVATPKDRRNEEPGEVSTSVPADDLQVTVYRDLTQNKITPAIVFGRLSPDDKDAFESALAPFFHAGNTSPTPVAYVVDGLKKGVLAADNSKALLLSAVLCGMYSETDGSLNVFDVFRGVCNG